MSIKAMKQALEALEEAHPKPYNESVTAHVEAITSLRQAIEQAEKQEPVAWVEKDGELVWQNKEAAIGRNLYTKPPAAFVQEQFGPQEILQMIVDRALEKPAAQRQPLTDEELRVIENKINPNMRWRSSDEEGITLYPNEYYDLVKAIEAAHGIGEKK
jgi:flagellin-specific chaperone FliS